MSHANSLDLFTVIFVVKAPAVKQHDSPVNKYCVRQQTEQTKKLENSK